ncbi:MAG: alcohol dehydrogenase catalytic domain-containing protein [Pseudomonadota bacterium]
MKAILSTTPGGPETLVFQDTPDPEPGPDEVLIDVKACGVNFPDTLIIRDLYQFNPERPFSPGGEVAGVVSATGANVTSFKAGDRVAAMTIYGGFAEKVVQRPEGLTPLPDGVSFATASALLMTYGTSIHALQDRAALKPSETLFVMGAAGGVGLAAVELGAAMGAKVVAAASTEEKLAVCREYGASETILYPRAPFDRDTAERV